MAMQIKIPNYTYKDINDTRRSNRGYPPCLECMN